MAVGANVLYTLPNFAWWPFLTSIYDYVHLFTLVGLPLDVMIWMFVGVWFHMLEYVYFCLQCTWLRVCMFAGTALRAALAQNLLTLTPRRGRE